MKKALVVILLLAAGFGGAMLFIEYYILSPAERYFSRWRPKIDRVV
jgi:hypothetical protein